MRAVLYGAGNKAIATLAAVSPVLVVAFVASYIPAIRVKKPRPG